MNSEDALAIVTEVGQRKRTSSTEINTSVDSSWLASSRPEPFTSIVTNELKILNKVMLKLNNEVKTINKETADLKLMTHTVFNSIEALINSTKFFVVSEICYILNYTNKFCILGIMLDDLCLFYNIQGEFGVFCCSR
jgi:hypothetical protein